MAALDSSQAYVLELYEKLQELAVDFHEFYDPHAGIGIIVCKNTSRIRRQLASPPPSSNLPNSSLVSNPPTLPSISPLQKLGNIVISHSTSEYGSSPPSLGHSCDVDSLMTDLTNSPLVSTAAAAVTASSPAIIAAPPSAVANEPLVYSISSHNRKAIQKRRNKALTALVEKRQACSPARRQGVELSTAYVVDSDSESDASPPPPQLKNAWFGLLSQQVDGSSLPYAAQCKIYQAACAIASNKAVLEWQEYLDQWRQHGRLSSRPTSISELSTSLMCRTSLPAVVQSFCYTFDQIKANDIAARFRAITQRVRYVELWRLYQEIEASPPGLLPARASGQTQAALARRFLLNALHPEYQGVVINKVATPKAAVAQQRLSHMLEFAHRWHQVKERLGMGVLGLIPESEVASSWIQQKLPRAQFDIWLNAVLYFNPACVDAGQKWATTLTRAMRGIPPTTRRKALEDVNTQTLTDPATLFTAEDPAELAESRSSSQDSVDSYSQMDQVLPTVVSQLDQIQHYMEPAHTALAEPAAEEVAWGFLECLGQYPAWYSGQWPLELALEIGIE